MVVKRRRNSWVLAIALGISLVSLLLAVAQTTQTTQLEQHAAGGSTGNVGNPRLNFTLFLHGIGKGGDNTTPGAVGAQSPTRPDRQLTVVLYNLKNQRVATLQGTVHYDNASGSFKGIVDTGSLGQDTYIIQVGIPNYLTKFIPGVYYTTIGQTTDVQPIHLVTGDIDGDNRLTAWADYSLLLSCWAGSNFFKNCDSTAKQQIADIYDDGRVDEFDYNLLVRELAAQNGDEDILSPQPTQPDTNPTATRTPTNSPTATKAPTATPQITVTKAPTATPKITATKAPTATPTIRLTTTPMPSQWIMTTITMILSPSPTPKPLSIQQSASVSQASVGTAIELSFDVTVAATTSQPFTFTDQLDARYDVMSGVSQTGNYTIVCSVANSRTVTCPVYASKTSPAQVSLSVMLNSSAAVGTKVGNVGTIRDTAGNTASSNTVQVTVK